ncbi:MAG: hypothetical protein CSA38_01730 [Flavobacteriales bacterium]|nr:MAG: hypothetical protein CSA38_01730 [Flavobacteriales bacterium]
MNSLANNTLIQVLKNISEDANYQQKYIIDLLGNDCQNVDEILLEYDDCKYIIDEYDTNIQKLFLELDEVLNEIDELGLHQFCNLEHQLWYKVRKIAKEILNEIV